MKHVPRPLLNLAILAIALCLVTGCETDPNQEHTTNIPKLSDFANGGANKKKDPKSNKDADKSPDQLRNEVLEKVDKQLENQEKQLKEATARGEKAAKKKEKEKKNGPPAPQVFAQGGTLAAEVDAGKMKKHPEREGPLASSAPITQSKFSQILGPDQKPAPSQGNTLKISNTNGKPNSGQKQGAFDEQDLKMINAKGSAELGSDALASKNNKDPNFIERLLGKKKEERDMLKAVPQGSQVELINKNLKKDKNGQITVEQPDGTAFGPLTREDNPKKRSVQALKDIYNPQDVHNVPTLSGFSHAPADRSAFATDQIQSELMRSRLETEAKMAKKNLRDFNDNPTHAPRPVTNFEPPPAKDGPAEKVRAPATQSNAAASPTANDAPAALLSDTAPITASSSINSTIAATGGAAAAAGAAAALANSADSQSATGDAPEGATEDKLANVQQLGSLDEYKRGLSSRDVVAREASFQRAVLEKRADALPYLAEEINRDGLLAPRAARYITAIGKCTDAVEHALRVGLNSNAAKDIPLREACAEALGSLRLRSALRDLITHTKIDFERAYQVRAASAAALGMIADASASVALHMRLDDRGESEFVKQSAALALARMGDAAGREFLIRALDSNAPALQILGMTGLAQLREADTASYLISALESRYPEVWSTSVALMPRVGALRAIPLLRDQLLSNNETMRSRAALALGVLGNGDGIALICRAARTGDLQERVLACDLLGHLYRTDQIPLLIEKLSDPQTNVRQTAAVALTQLNATAAIPAIAEAARGRTQNSQLPIQLRSGEQDIYERAIMLSCLRILRGEKDDLSITLPNPHDARWPEFDRELLKEQVAMLKLYKLIDVIPSGAGQPGALVQVPGGQEVLYRAGETVAAGFKVGDISLGAAAPDGKARIPPFVTLLRGEERVILYVGQETEVQNVREERER
ncbi:MAG TPA: HEAT repeat domain-containing protein [Planctomycetota bacterium]|nr:HEAT repeat domain-containing protein [Planctomycetota bacterium]